MSHVLRIGVADQIAYFRAFDTDGTGKTDFTSATTGAALSVFRVGLASVSIASLSSKAADNTTHADGAIRQVAGNLYTVDLPDAATADQTPSVGVKGSYTGGVIEPVPHPVVNYNPALAAVGANTVVPPTVAELAERTLPAAEIEQLRYRLGIDGTATAPSTATGAKLGDVLMTQLFVNASGTLDKTPVIIRGQEATSAVLIDDTVFETPVRISAEEGAIVGSFVGNLTGNVNGKVLGGGVGTIVGIGVRPAEEAIDAAAQGVITWSGNNLHTAATETTNQAATIAAIGAIEGGGGSSVNVLPAVGIVADRSPGTTITPVVGELISQSITLYATDGVTPVSVAGKTLAIVFETLAGVDVAVVASADITIGGDSSNVVTFAYPAAVTASERTLMFAIKDAGTPFTEYLKGVCSVTNGPRVDA